MRERSGAGTVKGRLMRRGSGPHADVRGSTGKAGAVRTSVNEPVDPIARTMVLLPPRQELYAVETWTRARSHTERFT